MLCTNIVVFDFLPITWQAIASVLTFILLVITVFQLFKDRIILKLFAEIEINSDKENKLKIVITNTGKKPITVLNWRIVFKDKNIIYGESKILPKLLQEGEHVEIETYKFKYDINDIKKLEVHDTTGKLWSLNIDKKKWKKKYILRLSDEVTIYNSGKVTFKKQS